MRNNKVVLSLVVASIAAMASVPELLKQEKSSEASESNKNVIDLKIKSETNTDEQKLLAENVKSQMETIWTKKTPATKVGESVDILVNNYGKDDKNIKNKIYEDLKLAQYYGSGNNQDSTNIGAQGGWATGNGHAANNNASQVIACHAACHSACHSACHGSRGWRKTSI